MGDEMLTNECFVGCEAEGPYKGNWMLFVPGCITPSKFTEVWERTKLQHLGIYFGAGGYRELRVDTLEAIRKVVDRERVPFMIETLTGIKNGDIVVIDVVKSNMYFKKELGPIIVWDRDPTPITITFFDDPNFYMDRIVT
jgi:uncharacterized protein (UPF0276 family)